MKLISVRTKLAMMFGRASFITAIGIPSGQLKDWVLSLGHCSMELNQMVFGHFHLLYPPGNSCPLLNAQVHPGNCNVCKSLEELSKLNKNQQIPHETPAKQLGSACIVWNN